MSAPTDTRDLRIRIDRRLPAWPSRVFDAWTDPAQLGRWMFGRDVRDERILQLALEPREGGAFSFQVDRGGTALEHAGRYTAFTRGARLAFSWGAWPLDAPGAPDSDVDLVLAADGEGCALTLAHRIPEPWAAWTERTREGWMRMLDALERWLQAEPPGERVAEDALRFERILPGTPERVWAHLIEPTLRARWLADGPMALAPGGDVALAFRNRSLAPDDDPAPSAYRSFENDGEAFGVILACAPPHRLVLTWSDMPGEPDPEDTIVEIALAPHDDGVRLSLHHSRLLPGELAMIAAGWHTHLGLLGDALRDRAPRPYWRTFAGLESGYLERFGEEFRNDAPPGCAEESGGAGL